MTSQPSRLASDPAESLPPSTIWPTRWHYLALATGCLFVVIYGSLVPLKFTPRSWSAAVGQFASLFRPPFQHCSRTDAAANFLLMVPVNYCLLAALVGGRRAPWMSLAWSPLVLLASSGISVGIEFLQMWFPERSPSIFDIGAQIVGAGAGLAAWIAIGPTVAQILQRVRLDRRPTDFVDWVLRLYVVGMLLWSAWPLNMTLSPAQWYHKYKQGLVILSPFQDAPDRLQSLIDGVTTLVIFIPVGMWAATVWTSPRRPARSWWASLLIGTSIALLVLAIDLVAVNRAASTMTLLLGIPGVLGGSLIMRRWRGKALLPAPTGDGALTPAWPWLVAAAFYALLLVAWFCPPQQIVAQPEILYPRFVGFFRLPLEALYRGSVINAVKEVLRKSLLFAPLGGLLATAALKWPIPNHARKLTWTLIVISAALWATGIEMLQILFPRHIPDSTDVVLCAIGAAIGVFVAIRLHQYGSSTNT